MPYVKAWNQVWRGKFDVVRDLPWGLLYYAKGPRWQAQNVADGAAANTIYDEINAVTATGSSTYRAASSGLNNQPCWEYSGSGGSKHDTGATAPYNIPQPFTLIVLCQLIAVGNLRYLMDGGNDGNGGAAGTRVIIQASPSGSALYGLNMGAGLSGTTAVNGIHAIRLAADATDNLIINGTTVISGNAGSNAFQGFLIGGPTGAPLNCRVSLMGVMRESIVGQRNWGRFVDWTWTEYGRQLA